MKRKNYAKDRDLMIEWANNIDKRVEDILKTCTERGYRLNDDLRPVTFEMMDGHERRFAENEAGFEEFKREEKDYLNYQYAKAKTMSKLLMSMDSDLRRLLDCEPEFETARRNHDLLTVWKLTLNAACLDTESDRELKNEKEMNKPIRVKKNSDCDNDRRGRHDADLRDMSLNRDELRPKMNDLRRDLNETDLRNDDTKEIVTEMKQNACYEKDPSIMMNEQLDLKTGFDLIGLMNEMNADMSAIRGDMIMTLNDAKTPCCDEDIDNDKETDHVDARLDRDEVRLNFHKRLESMREEVDRDDDKRLDVDLTNDLDCARNVYDDINGSNFDQGDEKNEIDVTRSELTRDQSDPENDDLLRNVQK